MILIFDTWDGLCNQIMDIVFGVNFAVNNNIKFCFRYAAFRDKIQNNRWYKVEFTKLFDTNIFKQFKQYIDFKDIEKDHINNVYNYDGISCWNFLDKTKHLIDQLNNINNKYIVLSKFRSIYSINDIYHLWDNIMPSENIMNIYYKIKNKLFTNNEKYNFIHYRYENDFTSYFNVEIKNINEILGVNFKNNYRIFIAGSNISEIVNKYNVDTTNLIYKNDNDELLSNLNYEQKAFVDFMFGKNSEEVYGTKLSSFSCFLNNLKKTNNFI